MNAYDLHEVVAHKDDLCLTLVLSTPKGALGREHTKMEYKKILRQLENHITSQHEQDVFLRPLVDLLNNHVFWLNLKASLVIYRSSKLFKALTLPTPLSNRLTLDKRFITKYLMPMMYDIYPFKLLWIGHNEVKLYESDGQKLEVLKVPNLPQRVSDVAELSPGYRQQSHTSASPHGTNTGFQSFYTGIGQDENEAFEDLKRFFKALDKALLAYLKNSKDPIVLMGVESMLHHYQNHSELPNRCQGTLKGLENEDLRVMHERALALVMTEYPNASEKLRQWVMDQQGKHPDKILTNKDDIQKAAKEDRIDTLFLWFDEVHDEDDWQEDCARTVLAHKGHIAAWHQSCAILYY